MAQLGSGQGTHYPRAIDTRQFWQNVAAAAPDGPSRLDAEMANDIAAAIVALQTTLGANPQGTFGSLAARLNQFLPGGGAAPGFFAFSNTTSVTLGGTVTNTGSPAVFFQVYDAAAPANALQPELVTLTVDQFTYSLGVTFGAPQSGLLVVSSGTPQYFTTFTSVMSLTIPGNVHLLPTATPFVQLYDDQDPRQAIEPETLTVHPTSHDVLVTFGQPQSGTIVLAALGPQHVTTFSGALAVDIPGATHNLDSKALLFQLYDAATPAALIGYETLTVDPVNYNVRVTFGQLQSGTIVLAPATALTGLDFTIRDGGIPDTTAVQVRSQTGQLILQAGSGNHVLIQEATGAVNRVDVDTATGRVGIGVAPTRQLQLSQDSAAKPGSPAWEVFSDRGLKEVLGAFPDGLALAEHLAPILYRYNGLGGMPRDGREHIGLIAQDVQAVAPYMVQSVRGRLTPDSPETDILTLDSGPLVFILLNAVKDLARELAYVSERLAALEAR